MRCLSVLDLVILFDLFIFFLGRKSQKVREWGVNSLNTSIFPLPFFFMNGNTERAQCALSRVCIP